MELSDESSFESANREVVPLDTNPKDECAAYSTVFLDEKVGSLA
jgi:hypothetical protein